MEANLPPVLLGPPTATQFCPNPDCRQSFPSTSLATITAHFERGTICGIWLFNVKSATSHQSCPNPVCQQEFEDEDESIFHLTNSASPCASWFQEVRNGYLFAYPNPNIADGMGDDEYDGPDDVDYPPEVRPSVQVAMPFPSAPVASSVVPPSSDPMRQTGLPSTSRVVFHPNCPKEKPGGQNILQAIDATADEETQQIRQTHPYAPFANKYEWELGSWLMNGGLSMREIDLFLHLDYIQTIRPSFTSAQMLRSYIESLPRVPSWKYQEIFIPGYPTKSKMFVYWRDGREVVESLFANPIFANCIQLTPYHASDSSGQRMWGEFMSGDVAWNEQSQLPPGHTLLGIIGASDKTALTFGTGGKEMHPFLLSIANIEAAVRMKASSRAFSLVAYLPIPKFGDVSKPVQSILAARVYHRCIDIVTDRLKKAAGCNEEDAAIMSNPWGGLNAVHTPLISWIADYPEQLLVSCTSGKHSPISIASANQFGDSTPHPPRTREITLRAIEEACRSTDPWDIPQFYKTCQGLQLNGVYQPFWRDWGTAEPSLFLTPDALHQLHKFFFDHILKWVINLMGGAELDYRLSLLQPRVGSRQWPQGVSTLKQLTGRDHRALETLIVAVAAGAIPTPVLRAIRAFVDFIFQVQNIYHYDDTLYALQAALQEFHQFKHSILEHGARRGKNGPLNHFEIPKLELALHVVRSIRAMGAAYQWTSDVTERCHIVLVKRPYRLSNKRDFHSQCCRFLDREEKIRLFSLYTTLKTGGSPLVNEMHREANELAALYPEVQWISHILPDEHLLPVHPRQPQPLFDKARSHVSMDETTAFLLTRTPHRPKVTIDDAAALYHLPDFRPALVDFYCGQLYEDRRGRRSNSNYILPFTHINIWHNVRLQQRSAQDQRTFMPVQTIQALPPCQEMPFGRFHTPLVNFSSQAQNESSGVVEVRLIFQPILPADASTPAPYLFYGHYLKFESTDQDGSPLLAPDIDMFVLVRHRRGDRSLMGDIMHVADMRHQVQLVPKFGQEAPVGLDYNNSMAFTDRFYLNNFSHKETFHAILSYQ